MPCRYYRDDDELEAYEIAAEEASPQDQEAGLQIVADIFNQAQLAYGLMGGMNFYLRGSGRTTQDVDLAVSRAQSLEATLNLLNDDSRITRPQSKMFWLSGVARIFVEVGRRRQQVQIDLKWQRAEGHGMPADLNAATELIRLSNSRDAIPVRFLAIGPLVKAKFQSYGRGFDGDYTDLHFVCAHQRYGRAVRDIAEDITPSKRAALVRDVQDQDPQDEAAVRWALRLDRSPSPEETTNRLPRGTGGGGSTSSSNQSSAQTSRRGTPRGGGNGSQSGGQGRPSGTTRSSGPTGGGGHGTRTSRLTPRTTPSRTSRTTPSRTSRTTPSRTSRTTPSRAQESLTSQMQRLTVDPRTAAHR